jgi:hypothetical protein
MCSLFRKNNIVLFRLSESDHYFSLIRLHSLLQRASTHLHNNLVPLTLLMVAMVSYAVCTWL